MKIKWMHVIRDVIILTVLVCIGAFIAGAFAAIGCLIAGIESPPSTLSAAVIIIAALLMGTLGFCLCGYLTIENKWKHLSVVAVGLWLITSAPMLIRGILLFQPSRLLQPAIGIFVALVAMLIGGVLSSVIKSPKEKEHRENKQGESADQIDHYAGEKDVVDRHNQNRL